VQPVPTRQIPRHCAAAQRELAEHDPFSLISASIVAAAPVRLIQRFTPELPTVEPHVIPGGGHSLPEDCPTETAALLGLSCPPGTADPRHVALRGVQSGQSDGDQPVDRGLTGQGGCRAEGVQAVAGQLLYRHVVAEIAAAGAFGDQLPDHAV
jgi:hypothetical protein